MNMPPQLTKANFGKIDTKLYNSYPTVEERIIQVAGKELHSSLTKNIF